MRERTPSADDTPKRAPPAPPREAASADVAGSKTSSEAVEVFRASRFSPTTTASSAATAASSPSSVDARMVASTHNLDDLGVSHPASASSDRQQQQEKHMHTYRSAQTAQDKRSRLSNVINNLRKKVPDSRNRDSPRKEEDDRNSVERNLETLEKYVMTVLNGVIKDEEDDNREISRKKEAEKGKESEKLAEDQEDEDSKGPAAKFEPSKPNESRTEAAIFLSEQSDKSETKECSLEQQKVDNRTKSLLRNEESGCLPVKCNKESLSDVNEEKESCRVEGVEEEEVSRVGKCSSKETKSEDPPAQERSNVQEEEKKENRSLGTIIMERLSENQSEEKSNEEDGREFVSDNAELRNVCRDLLNDLLNGINQLIDENSQEKEETRTSDSAEESKDVRSHEFSMTSLHCSLPLDKVASVLQNCCQTNEIAAPQSPSSSSSSSSSQGSKSPCKPPSPTVRLLCLYCDRKFMSISLRQRHTERVHQQGGGRRSERNSRRPSQNCQYCSDKCAESLEELFQHMVGSHADKYHACLQCSTRYLTREALAGHMSENHAVERNLQIQEKMKDSSPSKDLGNQSPRDSAPSPKERRTDELEHEHRAEPVLLKQMLPAKDNFSNPGSPEFDSSFYSSVSCNIRENLLHHLDGKLQSSSSSTISSSGSSIADAKPQPQQQQSFYEPNVNQIQFPIDISLTAATPVYSKEYSSEEYENNSEYAQKPGKSNRSHPRRVSFEKYNFPRKYDGKEQWTCSIKDLSKFDISTQLSLRRKQQLLKERLSLNRLHQIPVLGPSETTDIVQDENVAAKSADDSENLVEAGEKNNSEAEQVSRCETQTEINMSVDGCDTSTLIGQDTEFSAEFGSFLRLKKWDEQTSIEAAKKQEVIYAELTGEWSRPRVYICGACATKHVTLKEMEDHKLSSHPNVWCSHFEFSGDQRELYKHLFLPGKDVPTAKAKAAILVEKVCTKCSKNCTTLPDLHRHMLECGGDQAWLLGLFGNGKKKCKWRPFGSRSRRRRQRGMKRNIQNSQTPRVIVPKEKQPTGPRVRPSDRESIQKMLANLPPKRATRKVMQDSTLRTQGRLRNVQTRTRPRMVGDNSSASRLSRNKAALRNKLLKNAKSIQRNRCRIDNISAVIESVVRNYAPDERKADDERNDGVEKTELGQETKEKPAEGTSSTKEGAALDERSNRTKMVRGPKVLGKKRNVKTKDGGKGLDQVKRTGTLKAKARALLKSLSDAKAEVFSETVKTLKSSKASPKGVEKEAESVGIESSPGDAKSPNSLKNKSSTQTTPKRKRPVDPVASMNASIKAKSQLRTQDGKFARNPNKDSPSPQKSPEIRSPNSVRLMVKGRANKTSPEASVTRSKLRAVCRLKNGEQLPKRITRLSSDSDKMPTLEPAVQVSSSVEEFAETSANDLPILSPATPASNPEKILRGKMSVSKCLNLDDKESPKKEEAEQTEERNEGGNNFVQEEEKDQKQGKPGRRAKNLDKSLESVVAKAEASKDVGKEKFKRRSAPARILNAEEKKGTVKSAEEASPKKETKQKKEEGKLETRSNAKTKLDKGLDDGSAIKIQNVSFEVKKLIGSDNREDLLTKLALTSRGTASKRCLRQPVSKLKPAVGKMGKKEEGGASKKDAEFEKGKLDSGSTSDAATKKEKLDARRKSLRSTDKKDKVPVRDEKIATEDAGKVKDAVSEIKTAIRGRRSSSLSSERKSVTVSNQTSASESQSKPEVEAAVQNVDKRQTRGSLLNSTEGESQSEASDSSSKKSTVGKRRGRIKSTTETLEKKNTQEVSQARSEETESSKSNFTDLVDKVAVAQPDSTDSEDKAALLTEESNVEKKKPEEDEKAGNKSEKEESKDSNAAKSEEISKVNVNVNHLQVETSNSMDSGKENSLETAAPVQKLKVGRPRKSWGLRKERASKRSLNNVIGILTEGKNIPVETQQSVLSMQPASDNANSAEFLQNAQQSDDSSAKTQSVEDKSTKPVENRVSEVTNNSDKVTEEETSVSKPPAEDSKQPEVPEIPSEDQKVDNPSPESEKVESCPENTDESSSNVKESSCNVQDSNSKEIKGPPLKESKETSVEPANDIILDLSRRKQKGKGSFLEKIVSKIAKQKDALLEGEVGSLLDTAADELTSILDEVGPVFPETAENQTEAKNKANNRETVENLGEAKCKASRETVETLSEAKSKAVENLCKGKVEKMQDKSEETIKESCEEISVSDISTEGSENKDDTVIETEEKSCSKEAEVSVEILPNSTENCNRKEGKDELEVARAQEEIVVEQLETKLPSEDRNAEEASSCVEVQNERANGAELQKEVVSMQIGPVANEIPLPVAAESVSSEPLADNSTETGAAKQEEESAKTGEKVTETKGKRKTKKRSLEGVSPKKSKRKSGEAAAGNSERDVIAEQPRLADIVKLIEKSKQVPSTKENTETNLSNEVVGHCDEKIVNGESQAKDLDVAQAIEDSAIESVKERKVDSEESAKKQLTGNEEDKVEPVIETKSKEEEVEASVTEKSNQTVKVTGKKKTQVETSDGEVESPVRRSSKRKSAQEEKVNQSFEEEAASKMESVEVKESPVGEATEEVGGRRRRSSRTKVTPKAEEKTQKEPANDSPVSISNVVPTDSQLSSKDSTESCETSKEEAAEMQTPLLDVPESSKVIEEYSNSKTMVENQVENKEGTPENLPVPELQEPEKVADIQVVQKVPKKRGRKKKNVIADQTQAQDISQEKSDSKTETQISEAETAAVNQPAPRRSLRTSRFNEEAEDAAKSSTNLATAQESSTSLEPFKVPEVTEVLQHTKKRTYKRRSTTDEHLDTQNTSLPTEPEVNVPDSTELSKNSTEKEEQLENPIPKDPSEGKKRSSRNSTREQLDLERSSSSGSIDLTQTARTRSSKRKQLSSEDLAGQESLNQRAESADNLSETSCVSESSYFRKKRFSKKKKEFQELLEDAQTDTSVTDSESVDAEQNRDRRQSLKRRAKKNIPFLYLEELFDIPVDIQEYLSQKDTAENSINQELEAAPAPEEDKPVEEAVPNEPASIPNGEPEAADVQQDLQTGENEATEPSKSLEEQEEHMEEEKDEGEELKDEEKMDSKVDSVAQSQEDFQTPKKRAAGNYVVVHKKTGEILIVEKRKKLTKEAARFFCDVCATSFTRKSSLKKHNQSQSHLLQVAKSRKDSCENPEEICNAGQYVDISSDENRSSVEETLMNTSMESKDEQKEMDLCEPVMEQTDPEIVQNDSCYPAALEQDSLMDSQSTQEHSLEDELLDEEICKITENMSHDEYVLTDHVSPGPESTSTPVKMEIKKVEEVEKKRKHEKKKEKSKKKNVNDEAVMLDSCELENPADSTLISVLGGGNMSIKITKSSHLNVSDSRLSDKSVSEDSPMDSSAVKNVETKVAVPLLAENELQEKCSQMEIEVAETNETQHDTIFKNPEQKTDSFAKVSLDDKDIKESAPERLSLKFTINKRSIEPCKEIAVQDNSFELNYPNAFTSESENVNCDREENNLLQPEPVKEDDYSKPEVDQFETDLSSSSFKKPKRSKRSLENERAEELNVPKLQTFEEETVKTSQEPLDNVTDEKTSTTDEKIQAKQSEPVKTTRHGKSRRSRGKKHLTEAENNSEDKTAKGSYKSKVSQSKSAFEEPLKIPDSTSDEKSAQYFEEPECLLPEPQVENNSDKSHLEAISEKLQSADECESNELEIVEEPESAKLYPEPESLEDVASKQEAETRQVCEERTESSESKLNAAFSTNNDESPFSLADKALSDMLLGNEDKLETFKEPASEAESSANFTKDSDDEAKAKEPEVEEFSKPIESNIDENSLDAIDLTDNQKSEDKESNSESAVLQIASEEESDEVEATKTLENLEKERKTSPKPETNETVASLKTTSNEKDSNDAETKTVETKVTSSSRKSSTSDRQNSSRKVTRGHKHSNKETQRKSKGKKACVKNKITDLTSESDDSETENKMESQTKSKIVKSVFGRVFGGEKVDKVKEVLNDWVSKSEDDSDTSKVEFRSSTPGEVKTAESADNKNAKRHLSSLSIPSTPKKRSEKSEKKSKKSSSSDRAKDRNAASENQEEYRSAKHAKSKNSSNNKKKHDAEAPNDYFLLMPTTKTRPSKKRAEALISEQFEEYFLQINFKRGKNKKSSKHRESNYGLRNQGKPDLSVKDSGYGSFNYDEDQFKENAAEDPIEEQRMTKRRKSSASRKSKGKNEEEGEDWRDLITDKRAKESSKSVKDSGDEEECFVKNTETETPTNRLSVDLESSRSCSSLAPSSIRNRSPSMDRNSQSTRNSDVEEEEEEDLGHRRISPLFVCGTPRSCIESSSNSENEEEEEEEEEEDEENETAMRKRSSSEFSGEKIMIRSPSSTHKGEVVTIAPTDAIEDNALDVPQEIETTKPRQGKVLNFDEELFVECCSRLKATTENELRGAKKIKLDHNEGYHKKDDQQQGFRGPRDRWRDVESQNSLGSLLESVNQLLGEEMYSTRERDYPKRGSRNLRSEHSSRSASPDMSRADNLGYEDSLDVAFEHNNKLRDKIQQRMRESENLIASTFGQKSSNEIASNEHSLKNNERDAMKNSYSNIQDQRHLSGSNTSNGGYNEALHVRGLQEQQSGGKMHLDSSSLKGKMNSSLGGLLDKALSNLLHSNEKHDHNGSTPMKVLAELACARAPTSTSGDAASQETVQPTKASPTKDSIPVPTPVTIPKDQHKKSRNPIKELFERKKEMNERKQQEKSKTEAALRELNVHRQRKTKKIKKHQEFPLIRRNEHGGLVERKKRRDGFERKEEFASNRIKDVYEFDEEESQIEPNLGSVMSYRSRPGYEVSCLKTKEVDVAGLMSKAIGDSLENGKTGDALSTRLESMIDKKFKELEKFAPKTKGALKAFQSEDQQRQVTGPMDEFVERKQPRGKKTVESPLKHPKLKKRSKNPKKKARNSWYENDSSDEYRTAIKTEDVGVGISKSQRTCSKGKQNIFAELYTSSESEFGDEGADFESRRQRRVKKTAKKVTDSETVQQSQETLANKYCSENEDPVEDWTEQDMKNDDAKHESDNKKSESEMSDHPLVIDERKDTDEQRNSDEETETQYERNFEMDDLYREDSSIVDSEAEEAAHTMAANGSEQVSAKDANLAQEKTDTKIGYMQENELIPLEEALDLLDQADNEASMGTKYGNNVNTQSRSPKPTDHVDTMVAEEVEEKKTFDSADEEPASKSPIPVEEEEPDNDLLALPEKLSSNEKPQKESDNLPLHVFLSRKVQESKKRKEQQLKKMLVEQERILMDLPTRRQRKCAIGKQGLLAEISSSDEEISPRDRRSNDKSDHDKPRKPKRESKEKRKERYIEKKHEQMIAKEQKAIEEEILREVGKKKESIAQNSSDAKSENVNGTAKTQELEDTEVAENKVGQEGSQRKKHQTKEKQKKQNNSDENAYAKNNHEGLSDLENTCNKSTSERSHEAENKQEPPVKPKKHSKSPTKPKKAAKLETPKVTAASKKNKNSNSDRKNRADTKGSKDKERRSSSGKRDSDDEELKTTKSWNKVEEGVGVAIGRRKRAAANQLYYWSSSSDEEELLEVVPAVEEEEDDRQEQHGWIVGDSHKRMITMLAMEKQLKEKRRRSEDEFEPGRAKSKKHRNSTS